MKTQSQLDDSAIRSLLESIRAPQLPLELIARRVQDAYGLAGEWHPLGGEREQNFRLVTTDGTSLVVKVASLDEPRESLAFQAEALEHIGRVDPELAVPRLRRTLGGQANCHVADDAGREHALRILTFLLGSPFSVSCERPTGCWARKI